MPCSLVSQKRAFHSFNYSRTQLHVFWQRRDHITPVLETLHWLPVHFRIDFKVLLLVFKCLSGLGPSFVSGLLLPYQPSRTLRSSGAGLLSVPKSLPEGLRATESVDAFKRRLKTHLFNLAFNWVPFYSFSITHLCCPVIFLCPLIFS